MPQIIPPSPQTQEFEKYINFDVSLYNGLVDVAIPLHVIELDGFEIPIKLSYHSSGIKKGQTDGEVGVGWVFNPGYRVSRTIYGWPDEEAPMATDIGNTLESLPDGLQKDEYLSRFLQTNYSSQPSRGHDTKLDGEYDQFNYNLPTGGGSFIISNRPTNEVALINRSNVKINLNLDEKLRGLQLTDELGVKYNFGEESPFYDPSVYEYSRVFGGDIRTSWALTELQTPFGEQVSFNYIKGVSGKWDAHVKSFTFYEADLEGISSHYHWTEGVDNSYSTFYLQEINGPKEKVIITRNSSDRIIHIEVKTLTNQLIKRIEFFYEMKAHVFLSSIKVFDKAQSDAKTYKFDYYSKDEGYTDLGHDQWGYNLKYGFSGPATVHLFHEEFFDDPIQVDDGYSKETLSLLFDERVDRSNLRNFAIPLYFSLKRITYPTGGSTEYLYDHNKFTHYDGTIRNGGGIRIKQINKYDNDSELELIREFSYGADENGYGKQVVPISHQLFTNEGVMLHTFSSYVKQQRMITYSTTLQGDVDPGGFISSNIIYPEVTEYITSSKGNNSTAGKVVHNFGIDYAYSSGTLLPPMQFSPIENIGFQYWPYSPLYVRQYRTWSKPYLVGKTFYDYNDVTNSYDRVYVEEFIYEKSANSYSGLKVRPFAFASSYSPYAVQYYDFVPSFFNYDQYTITAGYRRLREKREIWMRGNDSIEVQKNYEYNQLNQIASEMTFDSDNNKIEERYNYPSDMVSLGKDPEGVYSAMVSNNMLQQKVEEVTLKNNLQLSSMRTNYSNFNDLYLPESIETLKGEPTSTNTSISRINYHQYDSSGNPLVVSQESGPPIFYLWGYDDNYPIAKIENAAEQEVESKLGKDIRNVDEWDLGMINSLRASLPRAAITTYTYEPLVGVKSVTDPRGETMYYEYDDFNRLEFVKDENGNILKEHQYNYKSN